MKRHGGSPGVPRGPVLQPPRGNTRNLVLDAAPATRRPVQPPCQTGIVHGPRVPSVQRGKAEAKPASGTAWHADLDRDVPRKTTPRGLAGPFLHPGYSCCEATPLIAIP